MNFAFIFIPRIIIRQVLKLTQDCDSSSLKTSVFLYATQSITTFTLSRVPSNPLMLSLIYLLLMYIAMGFPRWCSWWRTCLPMQETWDEGSITGSRRSPGGGHCNPLQYLPGESHGQRSLVGYSPEALIESQRQTQVNNFARHTYANLLCFTHSTKCSSKYNIA